MPEFGTPFSGLAKERKVTFLKFLILQFNKNEKEFSFMIKPLRCYNLINLSLKCSPAKKLCSLYINCWGCIMKKVFLGTMSFVAFLLAVVCWGNINPVYAAGNPVAEIITIESPKNVGDVIV